MLVGQRVMPTGPVSKTGLGAGGLETGFRAPPRRTRGYETFCAVLKPKTSMALLLDETSKVLQMEVKCAASATVLVTGGCMAVNTLTNYLQQVTSLSTLINACKFAFERKKFFF